MAFNLAVIVSASIEAFFSIFHFSTVLLKGHVRVIVLHHIIQYASLFFLILLCLDTSVAIAYICEEDEQQRLELS